MLTASRSVSPGGDTNNKQQNDAIQYTGHQEHHQTTDNQFEAGRIFHNSLNTYYISMQVDGHTETWPLFSQHVNMLYRRWTYQTSGAILSQSEITNKLKTLAAMSTERHEVDIRVGGHGDDVYLDLGNDEWEQVRITADGWSVIPSESSPVKFVRSNGYRALPHPTESGSLDSLREVLNLNQRDHEWKMVVSWLVGAMQPDGPFPILFIYGEQGSAKSTMTRILRSLLDPSTMPLQTLPRSERDLAIRSVKSRLLCIDNVSKISEKLSDSFCRLATGGGFATRQLYTDTDEVILTFKRPLIMNGISNFAEKHDLSDRGLVITMPSINSKQRIAEKEIWEFWQQGRPDVLGALCDAVSAAIGNRNQINLPDTQRMSDFSYWVAAAESALPWESGTFIREYDRNRHMVEDMALEADPVSTAILEFTADRQQWHGTPSDLLSTLSQRVRPELRRQAIWPKAPHVLSRQIKGAIGYLRARNIEVLFNKSGTRTITINKVTV